MHKIGIMGALADEVAHLATALENPKTESYAGVEYICGGYKGLAVVVCCAGMGKANAAATTQVLVTRYGAEAILFSGIAGNTNCKIGLGDVVVGQTLVYHDAEDSMLGQSAPFTTEYAADAGLVRLADAACAKAGSHHILGKIATGDKFIGDAAVKQAIVDACTPDCVEMEGAAVAQIAMRNAVPFVVLRTMSDNSDSSVEELNAKKFEILDYIKNASQIVLYMLDELAKEATEA